jgi:hypothetical protein
MNNIVYINIVVSYQKNTISVLLYRVKLNNQGRINMTSFMKRLKGKGEGRGPREFLPSYCPEISWISCGHYGNFLKISVIVPSPSRKRFPSWANAKLPYIAWVNSSGQNKGLFQAQNRKITMHPQKIEIFVTVY